MLLNQNTPQKEPTLEESVKQVMQSLPPVIRKYLTEEHYIPVAKSLMSKYSLHVDQGGVLEQEILLMLMGVKSPTECVLSLKENAHLSEEVVDAIMQDVNDQIFVPLRKEEEEGGIDFDTRAPKAPVERPVVQRPASAALPPPSYMAELPLGEDPPLTAPLMGQEMPSPKMTMRQRASSGPEIAPENLPGAMPERGAPIYSNPLEGGASNVPAFSPAKEKAAPNAPEMPLRKAYAVDPYREPLEESEL